MDIKIKESERAIDGEHKADYQFIQSKEPEDRSLIAERNMLLNMQEAQISRLDKVDKLFQWRLGWIWSLVFPEHALFRLLFPLICFGNDYQAQ